MVLFCEASSGFPWLSAHAVFSLAACRDCEVCIILAGHPERPCGRGRGSSTSAPVGSRSRVLLNGTPKVLSEGINLRVLLACKSAE